MKNHISLLLAVLFTAFTINAFAFTPPPKPDNGWYVVDQANKLSDEQKTNLNKKIDGINKNTKNEFAVLIIQSMDGDNIEDVAQNTFRSWGVGKAGLNNGILLAISVGDRKMRLQTGKGVEGDLPDLRAKDILDQTLKPHLKKGDFYGGIDATIDATSSYLESRGDKQAAPAPVSESGPLPVNVPASTSNTDGSGGGIVLGFLLIVGTLGILFFWLARRSARKEEEARQRRYEAQQESYRLEQERNRLARQQREKDAAAARASSEAIIAKYSSDIVASRRKDTTVSSPQTQAQSTHISATAIGLGAAAAAAGVAGTAVAISHLTSDEEAKKRKKREAEEAREAEAAARKRREEQEEADRKRREESYSSNSSYSSSSSDYSSSSSYSSYDSGSSSSYDSGGGGFGGGDSGGGGASSDW